MAEIDARMLDRRNPECCVFHGNWDTGKTRDLAKNATPTNGSAVLFGKDSSGFSYAESVGTNSLNNSITFPDDDDYSFVAATTVDVSYSISAWFYADSFTAGDKIGTIIAKAATFNTQWEWQFVAGSGSGNSLGYPQASLIQHAANSNGLSTIRANSASNPSTSTWHHIVITYNGSENSSGFNMYLDGVLVSTTKTGSYAGMNNGTAVLRIMGVNNGQCLDGKVSKILIFKRKILTAAEVAQLYQLGSNN